MHLAYLDDTSTHPGSKSNPFQVMGAVLIKDAQITLLEARSRIIADIEARKIIPPEKWEKFDEFHMHELYGGYGPFDGVDQAERFRLIDLLLSGLKQLQAPIAYGAVDKNRLAQTLYSSADALDMCFQICMNGVEQIMKALGPTELALMIVDDTDDKELKKKIKQSFRKNRQHIKSAIFPVGLAWHLHEDLYFGDSKESVGIQMADACAFFIRKHLEGKDSAAEGFYQIIEPCIKHGEVEPKDGTENRV